MPSKRPRQHDGALVLSRWLAPSEFGTFALINSLCIVANGFQSNLIICPLLVLGGCEASKRGRTYPTVALVLTSLLFPFWLIAMVAAAVYLHRETTCLLAMVSIIACQFQETTRRGLFAVHTLSRVAPDSATSVTQIAGYPARNMP